MKQMLKYVTTSLLVLCLLIASVQKGYSGDRPPNFIIVFTDDMGYGDLTCYGNQLTRTPNIDRLDEEGIRLLLWCSL
jgi:hypothetical protein